MTDWRERAACRPGTGVDPEIFYPTETGTTAYQTARAVCKACPVREPCAAEALANGENWGMWGGLSDEQRRKLRGLRPRSGTTPERETRRTQVLALTRAGHTRDQIAAQLGMRPSDVTTLQRNAS